MLSHAYHLICNDQRSVYKRVVRKRNTNIYKSEIATQGKRQLDKEREKQDKFNNKSVGDKLTRLKNRRKRNSDIAN